MASKKYRRKVNDVTALQMTKDNIAEIKKFCGDGRGAVTGDGFVVMSNGGEQAASSGDYIVKHFNEEGKVDNITVYREEAFERYYEPVKQTPTTDNKTPDNKTPDNKTPDNKTK